tara:strand:+ start:4263 stop:4607 length:345 start_codon:yes stop_codon:yes gene_type:complete
MKQQQVDYQDLIDLKFKVYYMDCAVHKKQYGYDDFSVYKKLTKRFEIMWDNKTRLVELLVMEKGKENAGFIEERIPIEGLQELKKYLFMFGHLSKEEYNKTLPYNDTTNIPLAC